jgi:hypothetical protein
VHPNHKDAPQNFRTTAQRQTRPLQPLKQFKTGIKIDVELESERLVFLDNDAVVLKPVPIVNADSNFITRAIRPARSNSRHLFAVIE